MLAGRLNNFSTTTLLELAISVVALAVALALIFRAVRRPVGLERGRDTWRSVKEALIFLAGPFPISIAIHVAVLLFLIHEVSQVVAPRYINIRLEAGGG